MFALFFVLVFQFGHTRVRWLRQFAESGAQKVGEEGIRVHIDGRRRIWSGQVHTGQ